MANELQALNESARYDYSTPHFELVDSRALGNVINDLQCVVYELKLAAESARLTDGLVNETATGKQVRISELLNRANLYEYHINRLLNKENT